MAIDSYLNNITSQHRDKPKFISWLSSNLTIIDGIYNTIKSIDDNFDLDNAIGVQLDTLGSIIGRKRTLTFQPLNGFSSVMEDDTYRLVLKAKVAMNNWDGTITKMYDIWNDIFGSDNDLSLQIQDNKDMSFTAYIMGYVDQIQQDLIQHGYIVPKPQGVRVNYIQKNPVTFSPYLGMIVSNCKKEVINMSYNPNEVIKFVNNSSIITGGIITSTINLKEKKVNL